MFRIKNRKIPRELLSQSSSRIAFFFFFLQNVKNCRHSAKSQKEKSFWETYSRNKIASIAANMLKKKKFFSFQTFKSKFEICFRKKIESLRNQLRASDYFFDYLELIEQVNCSQTHLFTFLLFILGSCFDWERKIQIV